MYFIHFHSSPQCGVLISFYLYLYKKKQLLHSFNHISRKANLPFKK